jgi:hypothetical protein
MNIMMMVKTSFVDVAIIHANSAVVQVQMIAYSVRMIVIIVKLKNQI